MSDVPPEQQEEGFVPGRDQIFEDVVTGEREEKTAEEESLGDDDSLTVVGAGHQEEIEIESDSESEPEPEPKKEQAKEKHPTMPAKKKFPALAAPFRQTGQCDMSWELLNPVLAYVDVEDPDCRRRGGFLSRNAIVIRVDVPAGVAPSSFVAELSSDGREIVYDCYMERSRYDHIYTLDDDLVAADAVKIGMQKSLQEQWTYIKKKQTDAGEVRDYRRYTVKLPETCEKDFRNPFCGWEANEYGKKGCMFEVKKIRSMFYYCFLFTVASKEATPAMASVSTLLRKGISNRDNEMNALNMAKTDYENQQHAGYESPPKISRSHMRKKTPSRHQHSSDLGDQFESMSISNQSLYDQGERRRSREGQSQNNAAETESQARVKAKGKVRRTTQTPNRNKARSTPGRNSDEGSDYSGLDASLMFFELLNRIERAEAAAKEAAEANRRKSPPDEVTTPRNVVDEDEFQQNLEVEDVTDEDL